MFAINQLNRDDSFSVGFLFGVGTKPSSPKMSPYLENCDEEISKLSIAVSNDLVHFKALYYNTPYEQTKALKITNDPQLGKTYG